MKYLVFTLIIIANFPILSQTYNTEHLAEIQNYDFSVHEFNERDGLVIGRDFSQQTEIPDNATIYYLDPVNGDITNTGLTKADPLPGLQEVLESSLFSYYSNPNNSSTPINPAGKIKGGVVLKLETGYHGELSLKNIYLNDRLFVVADENQFPVVSSIQFVGAKNFTFDGLYFSRLISDPIGDLFNLRAGAYECSEFTVRNCFFFSTLDSSSWSVDDWNQLTSNAIYVYCQNLILENNLCLNVNKGIYCIGASGPAFIANNTIKNFAADGMRIGSSSTEIEHNLIMNAYNVNDNHDDAIQLVSTVEVPQENIDILENVIIGYDYDDDSEFIPNLQGICSFGAYNSDWRIVGNWLILNTSHGISIYTSDRILIADNILVTKSLDSSLIPWIYLSAPENFEGDPDYILLDNIATKILPEHNDSNVVIPVASSTYSQYFEDYENYDLDLMINVPNDFTYEIDDLPSYNQLFGAKDAVEIFKPNSLRLIDGN